MTPSKVAVTDMKLRLFSLGRLCMRGLEETVAFGLMEGRQVSLSPANCIRYVTIESRRTKAGGEGRIRPWNPSLLADSGQHLQVGSSCVHSHCVPDGVDRFLKGTMTPTFQWYGKILIFVLHIS